MNKLQHMLSMKCPLVRHKVLIITSSKLLEPRSFDTCKNTAVPMIAMLGYLEADTEVLDEDMKTTGSNDCRGLSENNRDINDVLATM